MSHDDISKVWNVILNDPYWWMGLEPIVGNSVFKWLNELQNKHQVVYVSARQGIDTQGQTNAWLVEQGITQPNVIITKRKGEIAKALDIDFSIEDKAENAAMIHWYADIRPCKSYLINRLYNKSFVMPKNVKRINTIEEFLNDINSRDIGKS